MSVDYEWDVEVTDKASGDVIDHNFFPSFEEASDWMSLHIADEGMEHTVVLVRTDGVSRSWAYPVATHAGPTIPLMFRDAYDNETHMVPRRFHDEVVRYNKKLMGGVA